MYSRIWRLIEESFETGDFVHGFRLILQHKSELPSDELLKLLKSNFEELMKVTETWADHNAWILVLKAYQLFNQLGFNLSKFNQLIEKHKDGLIKSMLIDMKENIPSSALEKAKILSKFAWPELEVIKKSVPALTGIEPIDESAQLNEEQTTIDQKVNDFKEFLIFCKEHLGLKRLPKIRWYAEADNVGNGQPTFGAFHNEDQTIHLVITDRHPLDIMRTLAHELCHYKQFLNNELDINSGETGSPQENEANAEAGVIMRNWGKHRRDMFKDKPVEKMSEGWTAHKYYNKWLEPFVNAVRSNNQREAAAELRELIQGEQWNIERIIDGLQEYSNKIDIPDALDQQKQVLLREILVIIKKMDEDEWPEKWELVNRAVDALKAEGIRWPELSVIEKSITSDKLVENQDSSVPSDVYDFIDTLSSDDVGKERIGDYVVHFEGFSEMCQADAEERTQLPPSNPKHLATYDDIYKEVLNDFKEREGNNEPVDYGLAGDELYPVFYAVFHKPTLTEADLNHINQYHEDGGSLEGYIVDTDQPQIENYLTGQGASTELIDAIKHRYHRIAIIRNMWVDEEMRGGGIGTDLLGQAIGDAFAFGAEAILLVADMAESNYMPLDKWYEKFGFVKIGSASGDPVMLLDKRKPRQLDENQTVDRIVDHLNNKFIDDALTELTYAVFRDPSEITKYKKMIIDALDLRKTEILTYLLGLFKRTTMSNVIYVVRPTLRAFRMLGIDWPELAVIQKSLDTEKPEDDLDESLTESWSKKYKKSIDCSHPKGFSQRAHCAGRRARQAGQKTKSKSVNENFADGKGPGRPGDSQRHGIPKGATIAQLEKAAKAPGRKGQLARWQLNMRRGRAKNESVVNEGITVYHSSPAGAISKFNPFTHFGTEKAAADRIKFLIKQKKLAKDAPITVYKIDLNIHKPAIIKDAAVQHDSTQYAFALKDAKIFTQDEMTSITTNRATMPGKWDQTLYDQKEAENLQILNKMLRDKGYDGLAYKNKYEDKGQMSYVILDPKQAKITGKETIPAQEFVQKFAVVKENSKLDAPTPTVGELAEKYHTSLLAVKQQLAKGIRVEMEHTTKIKVAKEIALDHLGEDLYYYKKLAKIEKTK